MVLEAVSKAAEVDSDLVLLIREKVVVAVLVFVMEPLKKPQMEQACP